MDTFAASTALRELVLTSLASATAGADEHGCGGVRVPPRVPCLFYGVPDRW